MRSKNINNALILSVVVGTILNLINSYDVIWESNFTIRNLLKILLTYITPFCVSLYSSNQAVKTLQN
jgi:hypothetical protein